MALIFLCGAECNGSVNKFAFSGPMTVSSTIVRSGSNAWRCAAVGAGTYAQHFFAVASQESSIRIYVRWVSLPGTAGDHNVLQATGAGAVPSVSVTSGGVVKYGFAGGTRPTHPTTVVTGVWYRLAVSLDVDDGTGVKKMNLRIDGVDGGSTATLTEAAATITAWRWGSTGTITTESYWDDCRIDDTIAVHPIGPAFIRSIVPVATGTHSFIAGVFKDSAGTNLATNETASWAVIDDMPLGGAVVGDYWQMAVTGSTQYLEYTLGQITDAASPIGVSLTWAFASSAAELASLDARLNDGGTISAAGLKYTSVTTVAFGFKQFDTRPSGGGEWDLASVNALKVRAGYSDDITGYMAGVMVEVEFTVLTVAPGLIASTSAIYAPTKVSLVFKPGVIAQTMTVTAPTFVLGTVAVTPAVIAQTAVIHAPSISQPVMVPLISGVMSLYPPISIAVSSQPVTVGLIASTSAISAPSVKQSATPGLIASTSAIYAPTLVLGAASVTPGLIAVTPALYQPTFVLGSVAVTVGLISVTSQTYAPTLTQSVAIGLIASTSTLYAPSQMTQAVTVGLIAVTSQAYAPSFGFGVDVPLLNYAQAPFAPAMSVQVDIGLISQTAQIYAPALSYVVAAGLIDQTAQLYAAAVVMQPGIGFIAATSEVYEPRIADVVSVQLIEQTVIVYDPSVLAELRWELIARTSQIFAPIVEIVTYGGPSPVIRIADGAIPQIVSVT